MFVADDSWLRVSCLDQTLGAMKAVASRVRDLLGAYPEYGHPMDITWALESSYLRAAEAVSREFGLAEPVPKLCTAEFRNETLDRYVRQAPVPRLPLYHAVGASDPIEERDIEHRVGDGLPETLPEWIRYNGVTTSR